MQEADLYVNNYKYKSTPRYGQSLNQKSEIRSLRCWSMTYLNIMQRQVLLQPLVVFLLHFHFWSFLTISCNSLAIFAKFFTNYQ